MDVMPLINCEGCGRKITLWACISVVGTGGLVTDCDLNLIKNLLET